MVLKPCILASTPCFQNLYLSSTEQMISDLGSRHTAQHIASSTLSANCILSGYGFTMYWHNFRLPSPFLLANFGAPHGHVPTVFAGLQWYLHAKFNFLAYSCLWYKGRRCKNFQFQIGFAKFVVAHSILIIFV